MPRANEWGKSPRKNQSPAEPETFVNDRAGATKRLNLNMPFELHARFKSHCALAGKNITDVLIVMITERLAK